jgi:hypothetical protein
VPSAPRPPRFPPSVLVAPALELLLAAASEAEETDAIDAEADDMEIEASTADGKAVCTARKVF